MKKISLVESDDFSEWNPEQKRLFGTFGWKSCWQFNHEPELSWLLSVALTVENTTISAATEGFS